MQFDIRSKYFLPYTKSLIFSTYTVFIINPLLLQGALNFFGIVFVILLLNPIVFLPTLPLLILFFLLRVVYLASSRDVKRLEATS